MKRTAAASVLFVLLVVVANYATTSWGMIPVGFGLVATAGTGFAGLTFVVRDLVHDHAGPRVVAALIVVGAVVSFLVSDPFVALASGVAFLTSETADALVYGPLRRRGFVRASVASNTVGVVVDTFLFLWIAGFAVLAGAPGQLVAKLGITLIAVAVVVAVRSRR